jgi:hypothetical protein
VIAAINFIALKYDSASKKMIAVIKSPLLHHSTIYIIRQLLTDAS